MLRWLLLLGLLVACGAEEAAPTPPPQPIEAPEPQEEEIADEDEEYEEPTPPSYSTAELDAMEPAELEQACFYGSQAACDRLGH